MTLLEETSKLRESSDIDKLYHLMRIGLVDKKQLSQYKIALENKTDKVKLDRYRKKIIDIFDKLLEIMLGDDTIYQRTKQKVQRNYESGKQMNEEKILRKLDQIAYLNDIDINTILECFDRGLDEYQLQENIGIDQTQYAFARVNSFVEVGRAFEQDIDLVTEAQKYDKFPEGNNVIGGKVKQPSKKPRANMEEMGKRAQESLTKRAEKRAANKERAKTKAKKPKVSKTSGAADLSDALRGETDHHRLRKVAASLPKGAHKNAILKHARDLQSKAEKQAAVDEYKKQNPQPEKSVDNRPIGKRIASRVKKAGERLATRVFDLDGKAHARRQIVQAAKDKMKMSKARSKAAKIANKYKPQKTLDRKNLHPSLVHDVAHHDNVLRDKIEDIRHRQNKDPLRSDRGESNSWIRQAQQDHADAMSDLAHLNHHLQGAKSRKNKNVKEEFSPLGSHDRASAHRESLQKRQLDAAKVQAERRKAASELVKRRAENMKDQKNHRDQLRSIKGRA